jgi:hypothetical protein
MTKAQPRQINDETAEVEMPTFIGVGSSLLGHFDRIGND